jgi:gliding motility-associated-like protein
LVRLTIGAPNPSPLTVLTYSVNPFTGYFANIDTSICIGEAMYYFLSPWNPQSSYQWYLNGTPWSTEASQGILFNGAGNFILNVVETNFGCIGPGSDTARMEVLGPPAVGITGPTQICQGDTGLFLVPLQADTYYSWSSTNSFTVDTLNNEFEVRFPNPGTASIIVQALNDCGVSSAQRNVIVRSLPNADAGNDTTVCPGYPITLEAFLGTGYAYSWKEDGQVVSITNDVTFVPDSTTTFYLTVTTYPNLNGGCKSYDTLNVILLDPGPSSTVDTVICEGDAIVLNPVNQGSFYEWNTGENTQTITTGLAGVYFVTSYQSARCPAVDTLVVVTEVCEDPPVDSLFVPNVFTPNGDGSNNYFSVRSANIEFFDVVIYDRWGLKVGQFSDPALYWDGSHFKTGEPCSAGTYYYVLRFNFKGKAPEDRSGFITIIR